MKGYSRKQGGFSVVLLLVVLALAVFSANMLVRIAAMKWDNYMLTTILEDLGKDIKSDMREKDIKKLIDGRLDINDLRFISQKDLRIVKKQGQFTLFWPYERRENTMSNIDLVMTFNHEYNY